MISTKNPLKNPLAPPLPDLLFAPLTGNFFDTPLMKHRFDVEFNADSEYEIQKKNLSQILFELFYFKVMSMATLMPSSGFITCDSVKCFIYL